MRQVWTMGLVVWMGLSGVAGCALFPATNTALEDDPAMIEVVGISPGYAEKISNLKVLIVTIQFNQEMDPTIQEDFLMDQRGATDENGDPIEISGEFSWPDSRTLQFRPKDRLKPNATYQISLFSIRTKGGTESEEVPYVSVFKTVSIK